MTPTTFKIAAFFVVFVTGLGGGLVSVWLAGSKRSEVLFSLGNAFAGGIFLAAGLIHMLPDAAEGLGAALPEMDYPLAHALACLSVLGVLFIERVVFTGHHALVEASHGHDAGTPPLFPYILTLVLSIHSIITGIALGAEPAIGQAAVILVAVMAHKGSAAFALSVSLIRGGVARARLVAIVVLFCLATPGGILLGTLFTQVLEGDAEALFEAVFDSLAAGTFLYVALLDIVEEEFGVAERRWPKFALAFAGFALMAVLAAVV